MALTRERQHTPPSAENKIAHDLKPAMRGTIHAATFGYFFRGDAGCRRGAFEDAVHSSVTCLFAPLRYRSRRRRGLPTYPTRSAPAAPDKEAGWLLDASKRAGDAGRGAPRCRRTRG